jgi:hypothetical protein
VDNIWIAHRFQKDNKCFGIAASMCFTEACAESVEGFPSNIRCKKQAFWIKGTLEA